MLSCDLIKVYWFEKFPIVSGRKNNMPKVRNENGFNIPIPPPPLTPEEK